MHEENLHLLSPPHSLPSNAQRLEIHQFTPLAYVLCNLGVMLVCTAIGFLPIESFWLRSLGLHPGCRANGLN